MSKDLIPQNVDAKDFSKSPKSVQTYDSEVFNLAVSVPDEIEIRMVDASTLAEYEIWFFLAGLLSNGVVGFGVSAIVENDPQISSLLGLVFAIFAGFFGFSVVMTLVRRNQLKKKSKKIPIRQ